MNVDRVAVERDWRARGFSCDLRTDPPGQRSEDRAGSTATGVAVDEGAGLTSPRRCGHHDGTRRVSA